MYAALRLRFVWDEGRIALKDARPVAKRAPAGDSAARSGADARPSLGVMLELRGNDKITYRRQVSALFPDSHEVQTGDQAHPFARTSRTRSYEVEILVPAPDRGTRLVLTEYRADADARKGVGPRVIVHVDTALPGDSDPRDKDPRDDGPRDDDPRDGTSRVKDPRAWRP